MRWRRNDPERVLASSLQWDHRHGVGTVDHRLPCECSHARVDHVDPEGRWFDGPCQIEGCDCTPAGYVALRAS